MRSLVLALFFSGGVILNNTTSTTAVESTTETIVASATATAETTEPSTVETTAATTVISSTGPWPSSVPVPLFHDDFEDLTDLELHNNPQQILGKVQSTTKSSEQTHCDKLTSLQNNSDNPCEFLSELRPGEQHAQTQGIFFQCRLAMLWSSIVQTRSGPNCPRYTHSSVVCGIHLAAPVAPRWQCGSTQFGQHHHRIRASWEHPA